MVGREGARGLLAFVIQLLRLFLLVCHCLYHMTTIVAKATICRLRACLRVVLRCGGALVVHLLAYFRMRGRETVLLLNVVGHVTGDEGLHVGCEVFILLSTAHILKVNLGSLDVIL